MAQATKYAAVGRLIQEDGNYSAGKHRLLASQLANDNDPLAKNYQNHVKQIMDKGASKLKPDKRIRLQSDGKEDGAHYDLHVMSTNLNDGEEFSIVFFVVADPDFGQNFSVPNCLNEFKDAFLKDNGVDTIKNGKEGSCQRSSEASMRDLLKRYGQSKLGEVSKKVDQVKGIMKDNVNQALTNVESLENMENKSAILEDQGKQFQKESTQVRKRMQCQYYKVTAAIVIVVIIIIIIIVASVVPKK